LGGSQLDFRIPPASHYTSRIERLLQEVQIQPNVQNLRGIFQIQLFNYFALRDMYFDYFPIPKQLLQEW